MSQDYFTHKTYTPRKSNFSRKPLQQEAPGDEYFRAIVDASFNWEYLVDLEGRLVYISPACETISGYSPEDFQKNPTLLETIVQPEDRTTVGSHLQEKVDTVSEVSLQFRIITKGGQARWILHRCRPCFDQNGRYLGRRATNQDITLRKSMESERTQAQERLKQLSRRLITIQEAERKRISQDLHDDFGQTMTAMLLRLNAILNSACSENEEIERQLLDVIRSVELLIDHVRQLARQLHPPSLDTVPLPKALESLCSSFSQYAKLYVDFSSDKNLPPVPTIQGTVLYRFVQEGLNNVVKYARATSVWINLDYVDGEVSLSLEDNGQGFDPKAIKNGMGLRSLEERFRLLNGRFEIETTPGGGTRICGFLPLVDHSL